LKREARSAEEQNKKYLHPLVVSLSQLLLA